MFFVYTKTHVRINPEIVKNCINYKINGNRNHQKSFLREIFKRSHTKYADG